MLLPDYQLLLWLPPQRGPLNSDHSLIIKTDTYCSRNSTIMLWALGYSAQALSPHI